jgi:hypothetical protein
MLLLLKGRLINFDNVLSIDSVNIESEWAVRLVLSNISYSIKTFDSKSSAESFIANDFATMLQKDEKLLDLRKL